MIPELVKQYVETGMVRFVYRDFVLGSFPNSQKAAEAAACAGRQGKYWEMNEKLFAAQADIKASSDGPGLFKQYAGELGLDAAAFGQCLDGNETVQDMQADKMAGQAFGVSGTPSFFVNDIQLEQILPMDLLAHVIDYVAVGGEEMQINPAAGDYHLRGNLSQSAAITVAFVDYANAENAQHALQVLPRLVSDYVDKGTLVYLLYPWASDKDGKSFLGAAAAECAGQEGKYWEMHDLLFQKQGEWTAAADMPATLAGYARDLGLNTAQFEACLTSDSTRLLVLAGSATGANYGVPGAPVFLFNNGTGQQGSPTYDEFKQTIDSIINQ